MNTPIHFGHAGDDATVAAIGDAIRDWEPCLDLVAATDDPMIFEPDGTLYAVGLAGETTLRARHKTATFRRGDLIVVPRSVAIDAEGSGARFVAVRHDGIAPYHFRERFIQTWGYEHRPAATNFAETAFDDVIPASDLRFRVPYRRIAIADSSLVAATGLEAHLLVVLEGRGTIGSAGGSGPPRPRAGRPGALVTGGADYSIEGRVVVGRLILSVEVAYESELATALAEPTPRLSPRVPAGAWVRASRVSASRSHIGWSVGRNSRGISLAVARTGAKLTDGAVAPAGPSRTPRDRPLGRWRLRRRPMVTPTPRPSRVASALAVAAVVLGLAARPGTASGQGMISADPYLPYSYQYYNYTTPVMPNNLALPGAARDAAAYGAQGSSYGMSRYNSFGRWMENYETDVSGRRPGSAGASSRYDPRRPALRESDRRFVEREDRRNQDYFDQESVRARIAIERDRYYAAASREKDPTRRAAFLRFVKRLSDPKEASAALREIDTLYEAFLRQAAADARADGALGPRHGARQPRRAGSTPNTGTVPARNPAASPAPAAGARPNAAAPATSPARTPPPVGRHDAAGGGLPG